MPCEIFEGENEKTKQFSLRDTKDWGVLIIALKYTLYFE